MKETAHLLQIAGLFFGSMALGFVLCSVLTNRANYKSGKPLAQKMSLLYTGGTFFTGLGQFSLPLNLFTALFMGIGFYAGFNLRFWLLDRKPR